MAEDGNGDLRARLMERILDKLDATDRRLNKIEARIYVIVTIAGALWTIITAYASAYFHR